MCFGFVFFDNCLKASPVKTGCAYKCTINCKVLRGSIVYKKNYKITENSTSKLLPLVECVRL